MEGLIKWFIAAYKGSEGMREMRLDLAEDGEVVQVWSQDKVRVNAEDGELEAASAMLVCAA